MSCSFKVLMPKLMKPTKKFKIQVVKPKNKSLIWISFLNLVFFFRFDDGGLVFFHFFYIHVRLLLLDLNFVAFYLLL
jgi:hypothetical protein